MSRYILAFLVALTFSFAAPAFADDASTDAQTTEASAKAPTECADIPEGEKLALSCQRCGDGYCATSCGENEKTCPQDCKGEEW